VPRIAKPLVAGNWKMFKGPAETPAFCRELRERLDGVEGVDVAVCPPSVSLGAAVLELAGTEIAVAAQNVYGAIVGHSERRQYFCETDETVGRRATAALEAGLFVIACVGELEDERERGETADVLRRQIAVLEPHENLVVAYEPVWAIGTGKTATPAMAQEAHALIKERLDVAVLYGGSVKPENAAELMAEPDVDGALVGGASLEIASFLEICRAAATSS
jgi:triosephosphate isomerase (TIM)